ncbi:hypothetical protein GCM10010389_51430 [Streptomyces echinoruber]|uniref:Collagen-like protein n=1 Tax=Streptomyces echinoruber TaxID=68898 RepID=A0A918RQR2_9ACTN|nr:hypothetical protein GCM10010389_51430 [Streptomyces echinoruber]
MFSKPEALPPEWAAGPPACFFSVSPAVCPRQDSNLRHPLLGGPQGPSGPSGPPGPAGKDGADGKDGRDGQTCPDGYSPQAPSWDPDALVCRRDGAPPPESPTPSMLALPAERRRSA